MPIPVVLFACIHNSGRSVAARLLTEHLSFAAVDARSAGSEPSGSVNPVVARVLAERGLSTERETATLLEPETVQEADVVITMGCGEACPIFPGKRYEDWPVSDPAGQDLATVRDIVDEVDRRVRALLVSLSVPVRRPHNHSSGGDSSTPTDKPSSPAEGGRAQPDSAMPKR